MAASGTKVRTPTAGRAPGDGGRRAYASFPAFHANLTALTVG